MSQTRQGIYYGRDDTHLGYETDLRRLRYKHRELFVPLPFIEQRPRPVAGSLFGLNERTIRVPFFDHTKYVSLVKDQLIKFIDISKIKTIEVFVTANVVLCDPLEKEYSVWYGQDFFDDFKYAIDGPVLVRNVTDLTRELKNDYKESDVVDKFEEIFLPKSGTTVLQVINIVWILRYLSKLLKLKDELKCYTMYLDNAFDFRLDFSSLSDNLETDKELAESYYGSEEEEPRFFNYKNYSDWSRINNNMLPKGQFLCFYERKRYCKDGYKWIKIYDESTTTQLFINEPQIRHCFVLKHDEKFNYYIEECLPPQSLGLHPHISELDFIDKKSHFYKNPVEALNEVLNKYNNSNRQIDLEKVDFDKLTNNTSIFEDLDQPIFICSHMGSTIRWKKGLTGLHPSDLNFSSIAYFNEGNSNAPLVICLTVNLDPTKKFMAYIPTPEIQCEIIKKNIKSVGTITDIKNHLKNLSKKSEDNGSKLSERVKKKTRLTNKWWERYKCHCDCCSLGKELYSQNISLFGTQPREGYKLTVQDYLKIFNLNTDEKLEQLRKVYELCVASLDIESYTRRTVTEKNFKSMRKMKNVSYVGYKNRTLAVQKIALIGYGDSFNMPTSYRCFEIRNNHRPQRKTKSAKFAVEALMTHIMNRACVLEEEKRHILKSLFDFCKKYKENHFKFWQMEGVDNLDIVSSYKFSLVGQFEKQLNKLAKVLYVYTFNGGKYDFVLLHKFIAVYLKSLGLGKPIHLIKRDSRILRMSIMGTGIKFVDIMDMLGPESSLKKFAEITGQEETKMIFPFSCFTDIKFLEQKTLPKNKDDWYNDLKQEHFSEKDIEQANKDFEKYKCKNVGDYLKHYLKLDVELLGVGVLKYFNSLHDQLKLHPIDCEKTTIASYAGCLMQKYLMDNKRIAQFCPNLIPMYGCLKSASTGGLTMVLRHSADASYKDEHAINSHLSPDHNVKGQGVAAFDVSSLYPASSCFQLPFGPGYFTMHCGKGTNLLMTDLYDKHANSLMNSSESQVVQFLSLVHYPKATNVFSNFHAGPGQIVWGRSGKKRVDACFVMEPGHLKIVQYHDSQSHLVSRSSHEVSCRLNKTGEAIAYDETTKVSDDENRRYAAFMTSQVDGLTIDYEVYNECDMFHNGTRVNELEYPSPKEYLKEHHPKDSLFKPDWLEKPVIEIDSLLDRIMNTNECDAGFVVVERGAKELANDEVSKMFGFCLQKNSPTADELGAQAKTLAKDIVGKLIYQRKDEPLEDYKARLEKHVDRFLENRVKTDFTLTRQSFVSDQCLPVPYFKFLVQKREILPSVKILHYIHYEGREYGRNFMMTLLQDRHDLILAGLKSGLEEKIKKLTANSYYGQTMMEKSKYHRYTYARDVHLKKKQAFNATSINLLGAIEEEDKKKDEYDARNDKKKKKKKKFNLMYLIKYPETNTKIKNLIHVGACILGYSRVIFYNHILNLLNTLDSRLAELCYMDTDSMFFYIASPDLHTCVKEGKMEEFVANSKEMFVNPTSLQTQAGKLKMEGFFESAFFRAVKSYVINPFSTDPNEKRVVKNKGVARRVCEQIPDRAFYVNDNRKRPAECKDLFFQHIYLHPSMGENMFVSVKRRKMSNPINCKRVMCENQNHTTPLP